jgi:MoaA/NifB/PqqE/SkfB family radical SAM enzyme
MKHYTPMPKTLQLEISSNCNINCLGCIRTDRLTYSMKGNPAIPKNQFLSLEKFKEIIYSPACKELDVVQFCGSIDDPLMHPDLITMVELLQELKVRTLIHTNASLRTPDYFRKLAKAIKRGKVQFSLDGLEETNHLYRRGTNWNKIMENARAYIDAGGNAEWQYIEFSWNEKDTEEARQLAEEMGFNTFKYRRDRSGTPDPTIPGALEEAGQQTANHWRNKHWDVWISQLEKRFNIKENSGIECFSRQQGMYFIGFDGKVWPCCFLHNARWQPAGQFKETDERYSKHYGPNWNDLNHFTFEEIVNNRFYAEDLTDSWLSTTHGTGQKDRIYRCTQTCSVKGHCDRPIGNFKVDDLAT